MNKILIQYKQGARSLVQCSGTLAKMGIFLLIKLVLPNLMKHPQEALASVSLVPLLITKGKLEEESENSVQCAVAREEPSGSLLVSRSDAESLLQNVFC